jgi:hypothetical protein
MRIMNLSPGEWSPTAPLESDPRRIARHPKPQREFHFAPDRGRFASDGPFPNGEAALRSCIVGLAPPRERSVSAIMGIKVRHQDRRPRRSFRLQKRRLMLPCRAHPQYRRNVQGHGVTALVWTRIFAMISYNSQMSLVLGEDIPVCSQQ